MELRGEGEGEMIPTVVIHDLHGQQAQPNKKRNRCLVAGNNVSSSQKNQTVFLITPDPGERERSIHQDHTSDPDRDSVPYQTQVRGRGVSIRITPEVAFSDPDRD